jgi:hypothetical protein
MNYPFEKISAVDVCNTLLALAQKKKVRLERRKRNMGESISNSNERIDHINTELTSVQLLLETITAVYNALPEGSMNKVCMNVEVKRLEVRKAQLDKMAVTCNVHLLLAKQVDYNRLDSQVSVIDNYIVAARYRKNALVNATLSEVSLEERPLRSRSLKSTQISDEENAAISAPAVVHVKRRTEKTVYRFGMNFLSLGCCTTKIKVLKKHVQFPVAFIRPALRLTIMYGIQAPREYLQLSISYFFDISVSY